MGAESEKDGRLNLQGRQVLVSMTETFLRHAPHIELSFETEDQGANPPVVRVDFIG